MVGVREILDSSLVSTFVFTLSDQPSGESRGEGADDNNHYSMFTFQG